MKEFNHKGSSSLKPNFQYASKVPQESRREGNSFTINPDNKNTKTIEVHYMKRPETPLKLNFRDIISGEIIKIEEDSVNHSLFSWVNIEFH